MYIVAIDLPGHGSSSHLPKGIPYTDLTWVIEIKRTLAHLDWGQGVTIIAHSMGANASLELAALYPDLVRCLVMIDTIKPRVFSPDQMAREVAASIAAFSSSERNQLRPSTSFTYDVDRAIDVLIKTHLNGSLTKDAAFCLMQRAVDFRQGTDGGLVFKRDPR